MLHRPYTPFVVEQGPKETVIRFTVKGFDTAIVNVAGIELSQLAEKHGHGKLHLDLGQVEYLTGAALGKIAAMSRQVADAGGEFSVRNVKRFPLDLFKVTGLDAVINVTPKRSSAGKSKVLVA